jgi:phenylalanyl-tRNA synthetase beta chain
MRAPYSWLREHCDPGWAPEHLAERLAMTGTEVERISHVGVPSPDGMVVGRVLEVTAHPNADRLRVCAVDTGDAKRTIVCGAPNVEPGQLVPVALPGSELPGGVKLERTELRGVTSDGMILSEAELALGEDAAGIAVLDGNAAPGTPLGELVAVSEPVLELEITPNRPDCLGLFGIAREVHAISDAPLSGAPWDEDAEASGEGDVSDYASVAVEVPDLCPRFTARVFTDVRVGSSPLWLKARLAAAGQRAINTVVDITNYVMLLTAQPLHAFDLDKVPDGELVIRTADDGERMTTLDGVERTFDSDAVLVCDREGPSGIAGIMGGQRSEVSSATTRVLLEVATWNGPNILRTSNKLGLRSEASTRFEKQLHPELAMRAQRLASRLLTELCGARLVPGTIDVAGEIPAPHRLSLHPARVEGLLGMPIDADTSARYLERLGFGVERDGDGLSVDVPPDRHYDVTREVDLIEEVARIHGLDEHLPTTLPAGRERVGSLDRDQILRRRAEDVMRDAGFDEVVAWSFTDPGLADRLRLPPDDPRRASVRLRNPLSEDQSVMRTTLLGGLLDSVRYNRARGAERIALFESGRVYPREGGAPGAGPLGGGFSGRRRAPVHEPHRLGCLLVGPLEASSWRGGAQRGDFYAVKGVLEALFGHFGARPEIEPHEEPFLHPGRSAALAIEGSRAGWLGELHPAVARAWDLDEVAGFELELGALASTASLGHEQYEDVTTYPAAYQDVAVIVDEGVPASQVRAAVMEGGGELLRSAELFDLYRGEQIGEHRKSLALRLEFRAADRTLTDAEVAERRRAIASKLEEIGGALRD